MKSRYDLYQSVNTYLVIKSKRTEVRPLTCNVVTLW